MLKPLCLLLILLPGVLHAGALRERLEARQAGDAWTLQRDLAYGPAPAQRLDVYLPPQAQDAPLILLVHGGGWAHGDKAQPALIEHKVARWVPRGLILVSVNYRLLPEATPLQQAADVALALAEVQRRAPGWGGDPSRVVLMGHSAGAHLVALLSSDPRIAADLGLQPWLGSVALDSAALDVEPIMRQRHPRLYDQAFGSDPAAWRAASPLQRLQPGLRPLLAVCSSQREDACPQARAFQHKAQALGARVEVLPQDLSHRQINRQLGRPGAYTAAVERFLASLDARLAARLAVPGRR